MESTSIAGCYVKLQGSYRSEYGVEDLQAGSGEDYRTKMNMHEESDNDNDYEDTNIYITDWHVEIEIITSDHAVRDIAKGWMWRFGHGISNMKIFEKVGAFAIKMAGLDPIRCLMLNTSRCGLNSCWRMFNSGDWRLKVGWGERCWKEILYRRWLDIPVVCCVLGERGIKGVGRAGEVFLFLVLSSSCLLE